MRSNKISGLVTLIIALTLLSNTGLPQTVTNVGTDFWIAFQPNYTSLPQLHIFISSDFSTTGSVYSAYPGVNQNFTVTPGNVTQIIIPPGATQQGGIENKGVRITSGAPISVYGINLNDASTDAYMALPVNALGTDYRVVSYNSSGSFLSRFSVVATEDNTSVTMFDHGTNSTSTIILNKGETYLSNDTYVTGLDITGSRIQSDHPVVVYGSHDCVDIPSISCQACDQINEEMFPYYGWGRHFATVPLAGRDNSGDVFRIVAADDGTVISVNGLPIATINAGDNYQTTLTGFNYITTSNPVLLAQYAKGIGCSGNITGDPFMMLIPPLEQFITHYTIANIWGFSSSWVNIIAPDYALGTIYQDSVLIPDSVFISIPGTSYYGAQRSITWGYTHTFTSTNPFGLLIYGWNTANSYGYPGGCSMSKVATVQTVILSPDTSYGQLNVTTVCLTATVKDNTASPVSNILVNFYVSGLGPLTGFAYTDSSGNAKYCYTRTGSAPGTDQIYAEVSGITSNTVTVIWSIDPPCINPSLGGTVGNNQTGCAGFTPSPLINLAYPAGQSGTLEYKWQISLTGSTSGFTDIPGSDSSSYNPGPTIYTSWYKRVARVDCKTGWSGAASSNVLQMSVIPPLPVNVVISASDTNVCAGTPVVFTAMPANGGTAPVYQWKVNDSDSGMNSPGFTYIPSIGDQVSCVMTSNAGCTFNNPAVSNTIDMIVDSILPVSIAVSPSVNPVCEGSQVTITAVPVNGGNFPVFQWWINGINTGTNLPAYTYTPSDSDRVVCMLTPDIPCPDKPNTSDSVILVVNSELKVIDTTLCFGVSYYAAGKWQSEAGTYFDTLTIPVDCIHYIETNLHYKSRIPLDLGRDTTLCEGTITLDATLPGATYTWQDGSPGPTYTITNPGEYWVKVTSDNCQVSDSVSIGECPGKLVFPNAFTPNGDGLNDTFHPLGKEVLEFSIKIFNRWSVLVFEASSMNPGWDGMYQGQQCPENTYVYIANYKTTDGNTFQVKGYVILYR